MARASPLVDKARMALAGKSRASFDPDKMDQASTAFSDENWVDFDTDPCHHTSSTLAGKDWVNRDPGLAQATLDQGLHKLCLCSRNVDHHGPKGHPILTV